VHLSAVAADRAGQLVGVLVRIQMAALGVIMVAVAGAPARDMLAATVVVVQFALSGPVIHAPSHQLAQEMCNELIY
jgi:hypothetical protein